MAAATAVFTLSAWPKGIDVTQRRFILYGTVAVSATASGYLNGGIPITIATAGNAGNILGFPGVTKGSPVIVNFYSTRGKGIRLQLDWRGPVDCRIQRQHGRRWPVADGYERQPANLHHGRYSGKRHRTSMEHADSQWNRRWRNNHRRHGGLDQYGHVLRSDSDSGAERDDWRARGTRERNEHSNCRQRRHDRSPD